MVNAICCFNTLYMHGYANQNWKMDCCRSVENMHGGVVRVNTYLWDKSAYELILYKLGRQNWTMHHWKTNYEVHIFAETYCRFILAFNIYSQKTKKVSRFAKHTSAWICHKLYVCLKVTEWWSILRVKLTVTCLSLLFLLEKKLHLLRTKIVGVPDLGLSEVWVTCRG